METRTTTKEEFRGLIGEKSNSKKPLPEPEEKPIVKMSSYQANYPNWKNGHNDVFIEKEPQYPIYSVPFRGASSYKQTFTDDKIKKLISETKRVQRGNGKLT